jgi:hypothetical protein
MALDGRAGTARLGHPGGLPGLRRRGLVAIFVVARVAQRTLRPQDRVVFFRALGRPYGPVGGTALVVALGCGAALLSGRAWDSTLIAAAVLAACLALIAVGVLLAP